MKLNNILLIASFLFAAVACSMEDDVLNEMTKANPTTDTDATELYVSFNLANNNLGTKAGTSENAGVAADEVLTASVIVFLSSEDLAGTDEVCFVQDGVSVNRIAGPNGYPLNTKVLLKTGTNYDVYVIANSKESFANLKTRAAIDEKLLGLDDLNTWVKFGRTKKFSYAKSEGYPSIEAAYGEVKEQKVELKQLTAKVELNKVSVTGFANNTLPADVTLKSVKLLNQNTTRQLKGGQTGGNSTFANVAAWGDSDAGIKLYGTDAVTKFESPIASFNTYPNSGVEGESLTALELTFQVGNQTVPQKRTYVINRPTGDDFTNNTSLNETTGHERHTYIQAGYIYQLEANVKVTGDDIECTIKCYTLDWLYNEFEVEVEEVTSEIVGE